MAIIPEDVVKEIESWVAPSCTVLFGGVPQYHFKCLAEAQEFVDKVNSTHKTCNKFVYDVDTQDDQGCGLERRAWENRGSFLRQNSNPDTNPFNIEIKVHSQFDSVQDSLDDWERNNYSWRCIDCSHRFSLYNDECGEALAPGQFTFQHPNPNPSIPNYSAKANRTCKQCFENKDNPTYRAALQAKTVPEPKWNGLFSKTNESI